MSVVIETTVGDVTVDLFLNERPKTCMNFIKLCKMKYYNFNLIFSIDRNFIAQTGDPTGTGKGGGSVYHILHGDSGRFYPGEKAPSIKHTDIGLISMAACGDGLYGSQFFFTLGENLDSLDGEHLVFGKVVEGMDILERLNDTLIDEVKRPYQDILITHTVVLSDPYPDPEGLEYPSSSPSPPSHIFNSNYISADEQLESDDIKSLVEIREEIESKEAEARATILEMVGDLPSADMAPPENVLFVCKLNPVTTSEDLEIIFSRFGKVNSSEVICDHVTGNSLQYAFVEFANQKHCEDAYFKMDNVLIDDRRIHVDFSQSVSKVKWKGKGRGVDYFDNGGRKVSRRDAGRIDSYLTHAKNSSSSSNCLVIDNSKASDPLYRADLSLPKNKKRPVSPHGSKEDASLSEKSEKERKRMIKKLKKELKKKRKKDKKEKSKKKRKRKSSTSSSSSSE